MEHPEVGVLLDIARRITDPSAWPAEDHTGSCRACRRVVDTMRGLAEFAAGEAEYEAPADAVDKAERIFPSRQPAGRWLSNILTAYLVYDSVRDPLPAGARGQQNTARQVLYEAGSYSLNLHISDEWTRRELESPRLIVVGEVSDRSKPATALPGRTVELWSGDEVVAQSFSNDLGEFHLESARREALQLRVGVGPDWIEVPVRVLEPAATRGSVHEG